jgi:mRNA-degrading endonuclease RelE of RelBE toxin-antitoxin system
MPYRIDLSPEALRHLGLFTARLRSTIADTIEEQLAHQPTVKTRNRKPMKPNLFGDWELRIGDFRVYYKVEEEPEQVVVIRAIGVKVHNRVFIGGEEVEL